MTRRFVINTVTFFLSLILILALSEGLLRMIGFKPWIYESMDANEPIMHEPDPVLGWRNKKGSYIVPPYHPSGKNIHVTFLENGQRYTGVNSNPIEGELVIVGGSVTQGWAISDNETYPWKLQEHYPSLNVLNYGTGAYGSYQSLLVLEQELPRLTSPKLVIYGFIAHHEVRNVAPAEWLRGLSSFSRRGHVDVPFATFDDDKGLVRYRPERYLSLPFRESLAIVALFEKAYMKIKTRKRSLQRRIVTRKVLLQMKRVSDEFGAAFVVVLLHVKGRAKNYYMNFFNENNIQFIDCVYNMSNKMRVPGEGHPNGKMNTRWAECISASLDERIGMIKMSKPL